MKTCTSCGTETTSDKKLCAPCHRKKLTGTWKRQITIYSTIIIAGAIMFYYAITQINSLPHSATEHGIPPLLRNLAAFGGLGVLGGLFGLALALFFNFLHRKNHHNTEQS